MDYPLLFSDLDISIHALREEGDDESMELVHEKAKFLSTPSARRATMHLTELRSGQGYFYPRPPRGGRR